MKKILFALGILLDLGAPTFSAAVPCLQMPVSLLMYGLMHTRRPSRSCYASPTTSPCMAEDPTPGGDRYGSR